MLASMPQSARAIRNEALSKISHCFKLFGQGLGEDREDSENLGSCGCPLHRLGLLCERATRAERRDAPNTKDVGTHMACEMTATCERRKQNVGACDAAKRNRNRARYCPAPAAPS